MAERHMGGEGRRGAAPADDGFTDRFLLVYPKELPDVGERWLEVSPTALDDWEHVVEHLLSLKMETETDGRERPRFVQLSAEGKQEWERFTREHAAEVNAADFPDHLRGAWAKLRGYCARQALVLNCLRRACRSLASDGRDKKTGFTRRDLYQCLRKSVAGVAALDAPLGVLVEHHYLRVNVPDRSGRPGPNPARYEVNPLWDRQTGTQDTQDIQDPDGEGEPVYPGDSVYRSEGGEGGRGGAGGRAEGPRDTRDQGPAHEKSGD